MHKNNKANKGITSLISEVLTLRQTATNLIPTMTMFAKIKISKIILNPYFVKPFSKAAMYSLSSVRMKRQLPNLDLALLF